MAIRMMTDASKAGQPNVETVTNYSGHETTRVHHDFDCPHYKDRSWESATTIYGDCLSNCKHFSPLYMETTCVGRVLKLRERNMYDDSDFYALVWDDEKNAPHEIEYASTRGWTYPNGAAVDADPATLEKYMAWVTARQAEAREAAAIMEAATPRVGKNVVTTVTRGKNKGKTGRVVWFGPNGFVSAWERRHADLSRIEYQRVGVQTDSGEKFFIGADKVKVL